MSLSYVRRPTSPVFFDPLRPEREEILCPGSDEDETHEGHRNKRRRVEEAASQYLRGKTLYISSSRLYGPLNSGWSNPWASKSTATGRTVQTSKRRPEEKPDPIEALPGQISEVRNHGRSLTLHDHVIAERDKRYLEPNPPRPAMTGSENERPGSQDSFVTALSESTTNMKQLEKGQDMKEAKGWLKSSEAFLRRRPQNRQRLQSPTPMPKRLVSPSPVSKSQRLKPQDTVNSSRNDSGQYRLHPKLASPVSISNEKPMQVPRITSPLQEPQRNSSIELESKSRLNLVSSHTNDDMHNVDQATHIKGKHAYKEPAEIAGRHSIVQASKDRYIETGTDYEITSISGSEPETRTNKSKRSAHKLPPSATLPDFEYRPVSEKVTQQFERKSFAEELKASKRKARAKVPKHQGKGTKWKVSFTASGGVKSQKPHTSPEADSSTPLVHQAEDGSTSQKLADFPEAQIVSEAVPVRIPSGPSTELLETDKQSAKFPSTEEYIISTQEALVQAQRSFQIDTTPLVERKQADAGISPAVLALRSNEGPFRPTTSVTTPGTNSEPMNTQAIIDAMSPFPVTTIKRKPQRNEDTDTVLSTSASSRSASQGLNECPSPEMAEFQTNSISMSTSPSPPPAPTTTEPPLPLSELSKPSSTIASFSVAPNGTCTEYFQEDGQQRQGLLMDESEMNDALEDMDSFLGGWNVEAVARDQAKSRDFGKANKNHPS